VKIKSTPVSAETTKDYFSGPGYKNTFFYTGCFLLFWIFYLLFFFQATTNSAKYASDLPAHIAFSKDLLHCRQIGYALFHFSIFILDKLPAINLYSGSALLLSASCVLCILLIRWYFRSKVKATQSMYWIDALSITLVFVFNVFLPSYSPYIYYLIGGFNIWHNPTYLFMKPFALLSFIFFVQAYDKYRNQEKYLKTAILFFCVTIVSIFAKPSYALMFLPALALFLVIEFIKRAKQAWKFCIIISAFTIPIVILMYFQSVIVFQDTKTGLIFDPGGEWANSISGVIIPILLVNAFSVFVLCFGGWRQILSDKVYQLSFLAFTSGCLQFYTMAEIGSQGMANLAWGYYMGAFLLCVTSSFNFFFKMEMKPAIRNIGFGIFGIQLVSGIYYFSCLLFGGFYF